MIDYYYVFDGYLKTGSVPEVIFLNCISKDTPSIRQLKAACIAKKKTILKGWTNFKRGGLASQGGE